MQFHNIIELKSSSGFYWMFVCRMKLRNGGSYDSRGLVAEISVCLYLIRL